MLDVATRRVRLAALLGACLSLAGCLNNPSTTTAAGTSSSPSSVTVPSAGAPVSSELPVISGTPAQTTLGVGKSFSFTPTAGSPTGATLAFLLMNAPAFLSINTATGAVTGVPSIVDIGSYPNVRVAVSDGVSTVAGPAFTLTVVADATQPTTPAVTGTLSITGSPVTAIVEGVAWSFRPTITVTGSGSAPVFRVANAPAWTTFDATTGTLSGAPPPAAAATYPNIVISVSDGVAEAALPAFTLSVTVPALPTISGKPTTVATVGASYSFVPVAKDPNGYPLVYKISGKPAWASFDPTTGALTGTPGAAAAGTSTSVTISVTDGFSSASLPAYALSVANPVSGSATVSWSAPTRRADGTPLTNLAGFRVYYGTKSGKYPNSIAITNPALSSFTVDALPAGTYYFVATAFDANGNESAYSTPVSKTIS